MAHENSHDDHGHDTEGKRQYYPKGWHIPLIGLIVVALGVSIGAGLLLGISGTDKWGKTEEVADHHDGTHMEGDHHDGDHHDGDHHDATGTDAKTSDGHHNDSANVTAADTAKGDSAKPAEHGH